jgi:hypothetical protein
MKTLVKTKSLCLAGEKNSHNHAAVMTTTTKLEQKIVYKLAGFKERKRSK